MGLYNQETAATNLQTQEVQGVSKEKYPRLPNIASTTWVKPRIVCHRDCNWDSDAQIKCEGMSQQERPREDRREAKARDLNNAWRLSQSKDTLDTRPQETATSRETVEQGKETMPHPMRKIDVEASHTLHKTRWIQQFNNSEGSTHKDMLSRQVESDERSQIRTTAIAQPYKENEREKKGANLIGMITHQRKTVSLRALEKQEPTTYSSTHYSEEKDSVTRLEWKRRGPGIPTAGRSNLTLTPSLDNIGKAGMDLKLEVEAWKFMSSIIPSEHQETIQIPEGAWCQNDYVNNMGQFTASQQENHPTKMKQNYSALKQMSNEYAISPACHQTAPVRVHKDETTTSRRRIFEEEDIHETGTKPSNNL